MLVAQLAEVYGSSPVISKILYLLNVGLVVEKTKIKKKRPGEGHQKRIRLTYASDTLKVTSHFQLVFLLSLLSKSCQIIKFKIALLVRHNLCQIVTSFCKNSFGWAKNKFSASRTCSF